MYGKFIISSSQVPDDDDNHHDGGGSSGGGGGGRNGDFVLHTSGKQKRGQQIVQIYAPVSNSDEDEAEWLYEEVTNAKDLVRGGFQPRLPTSLPPPGQQQQPSPLPRRQPVPLMPPAQLHPGAPQVVAPAPAVPLQSPPPSELMDVDPSAGPPSQAVAVQPVLQPLSLGTPKESDTAAPCPAHTQQPSTQRQETLPLFVGPDSPSRPMRPPAGRRAITLSLVKRPRGGSRSRRSLQPPLLVPHRERASVAGGTLGASADMAVAAFN
ncbi:proline-rich protein 2-like [Schistocerca serialis cubense]|uniref:proline-rich protein 2-like n=1 Tax=Schistocerca serialis cubense TaxID=2023355 RepID=UPI00214E6187|nr:proline-rich protein 2-like [Schistocerca serialis cubense]